MILSTSVLLIAHLEIMIRSFSKISVLLCQRKFKKTDLKPRDELELQKSNKGQIRTNNQLKKYWTDIEQVLAPQRKEGLDLGITRLLHQQDLIISQMRKWNLKK